MDVITGSCLCGEIQYEVDGPLGNMGHCHCETCQKSHGAAYATYVNINANDFNFTKGESNLTVFQSSAEVERTFCKKCGSNLQFRRSGKNRIGITVASLDCKIKAVPDYEIWTASSPDWGTRQDIPLSHKTDNKNNPI